MKIVQSGVACGKLMMSKTRRFCTEHRGFTLLWGCYAVALAIIYAVLPITYEANWLYFFRYLFRNGALPYIQCRVGYPPIGFLTYMPFAWLAGCNLTLFAFCQRAINGALLLSSMLLMYIVIDRVWGRRDAVLASAVFVASASTFRMNIVSNDVIALFFTLLALYFMLMKRSILAGMNIGFATMVKGFPALLFIPALKWFKDEKSVLRLAGAFFMTIYFISLPFLVLDPFMYVSTFVHHWTRGPWETVWALLDGWQSHGGFLHPDFDQFFYHFQLLRIYPLLRNDHAFYAWRYPDIPIALTICQFAIVAISYLLIGKKFDENSLLRDVGLIFLGYMLFFKGYSPQFTVFLLPMMLISLKGLWKVCLCVPLEISTILQLLAWGSEGWFTYDYHMPILVSGVIIRTATLIAAVGLLSFQLLKISKMEAGFQ